MLGVPVLVEGDLIWLVAIVRTAPDPFLQSEIELVSTFADQAAIAIANARLIDAVERQRSELARFVSPQVAQLVSSVFRQPSASSANRSCAARASRIASSSWHARCGRSDPDRAASVRRGRRAGRYDPRRLPRAEGIRAAGLRLRGPRAAVGHVRRRVKA
jgi:hypothetical protein